LAYTHAAGKADLGDAAVTSKSRWLQLLLGFIVLMTISSPQNVWTVFALSFQASTGAIPSKVQWTITILIVLQAWLSSLQGFLVDRFGPKLLIGLGAVLSGAGWTASSTITSLTGLYATYGLHCGIGRGRLHRHHRPDGEMVS
jgi:MFS transporter, OFA family, oxalate/formate antiporter